MTVGRFFGCETKISTGLLYSGDRVFVVPVARLWDDPLKFRYMKDDDRDVILKTRRFPWSSSIEG